jgi:hypothetical protein
MTVLLLSDGQYSVAVVARYSCWRLLVLSVNRCWMLKSNAIRLVQIIDGLATSEQLQKLKEGIHFREQHSKEDKVTCDCQQKSSLIKQSQNSQTME